MNTLRRNLIRLANDLPKGEERSAVLNLVAGRPLIKGGDMDQIRDKVVDKLRNMVSRVTLNDAGDALNDLTDLKDEAESMMVYTLGYYRTERDGDDDFLEELEDLESELQGFIDEVENGIEMMQEFLDEADDEDEEDPRVQMTMDDVMGDVEGRLDDIDRMRFKH